MKINESRLTFSTALAHIISFLLALLRSEGHGAARGGGTPPHRGRTGTAVMPRCCARAGSHRHGRRRHTRTERTVSGVRWRSPAQLESERCAYIHASRVWSVIDGSYRALSPRSLAREAAVAGVLLIRCETQTGSLANVRGGLCAWIRWPSLRVGK